MNCRVNTRTMGIQTRLVLIGWFVFFAASARSTTQAQEAPTVERTTLADASLANRKPLHQRSSLERVPLSTDLYVSIFHLRETWQGLVSSPLAKELVQSQLWQKTQVAFLKEWKDRKSDIGRYRSLWENQSVKDLRRFLEDLASEDLFFYADESLSKTLLQLATIQKKLHVLTSEETRTEVKADLAAQWIDQLLPAFQFPTIMVGARFADRDLALAKVDELEGLIRFGIGSIPDAAPLLKPLKRIEDERGSRLQWQVYGKALPWDSIPEGDILDRESLQDLRNTVAEKSLTLTFGMIDGYFVASIGGDPEAVNNLGKGLSLLDHHQLTPLQALFSNESGRDQSETALPGAITHVTWISDDLANAAFEVGLRGFFERLSRTAVGAVLPTISRDGDMREFLMQIIDESARIDTMIEAHVPSFRGYTGWSVITEDGWESIGISRTESSLFDGELPLFCVSKVDRIPLLLLDVRIANHPEYFQTARDIAKRIRALCRDFLKVDESEIGNATMTSNIRAILAAWPLLEQWADNWQQKILSNFTGEHAFMISPNGPAARQWHPSLPPSDELLALPEVSITHVLNDEKVWWEGMLANWQILLKMFGGDNGPLLIQGIKKALAPFPASGFEDHHKFVPSITLLANDSDAPAHAVWAHTLRSDAAENGTLLQPGTLGIVDPTTKQSVAAFIDLGGLVKQLRPWVRYGLLQVADTDSLRLTIPRSNRGTELELYVDDVLGVVDILGRMGTLSSSRDTRSLNFANHDVAKEELTTDGSGTQHDSKSSDLIETKPAGFVNRWRAVYRSLSTD